MLRVRSVLILENPNAHVDFNFGGLLAQVKSPKEVCGTRIDLCSCHHHPPGVLQNCKAFQIFV